MKPIEFHPRAEAEVESAVAYYESRRRGLGIAFLEEVEQASAGIQRNPGAFSPIGGTDCRMLILSQFHYAIVYRELQDRIRLIAVAHHRRRPNYWRNRLTD